VISSLGGVVENVYRVSRQTGEVSQLFSSSGSHESAQFSNDGNRIVVLRHPEGLLSVCSGDGSACRQLTNVGAAGSPRFSPDDRLVAFDAYQSGGFQVFVVAADGGPARRLAPGARPTWSRDGTWIYFNCKGGMETLCKVPSAGGEVLEVGVPSGAEAAEGPDGSTLYYIKPGHVGVWAAPATGGAEQRVLDLGSEGKWAMGKQGIYTLSRTGVWAIEYFDLATKKAARVVRVPILDRQARQGVGPAFSVSSDEQWFLCGAFERYETDLKLVENFR
jgi:Tol biopolymer transport system component